ncbi:uncharacterized protein [Montipora capricornis]|uniref:uncharacterized protein n=1 Tax=Montipora capricornis TaxID=246305 RepID=UPI0035F107D0
MSAEETEHLRKSGSGYSENGRTNPGFDDPLRTGDHDNITDSHGRNHPIDWQKFAKDSMEDYLSRCPGNHGQSGQQSSGSQVAADPSVKDDRSLRSDTEEEENCDPEEPSENPEQFLRYVFHLYLDETVESVKILTEKPMSNGNVTRNLKCCPESTSHWMSPPLFIHAYDEETFRYRYVVKYKEGLGSWLLKKVTGGKDDKTVKETCSRKLNYGMHQYDIFHAPNESNQMKKIFLGQMFFVEQLYDALGKGGDLKEILIECEHVGFGHPSYAEADVRSFIHWVSDILIKTATTPFQRVYICALLGQFVKRMHSLSAWRTCDLLGKRAADQLLSSFGCCSHRALPQSSIKFIKIIAEELLKAGSSTGCLMFIKIFCNLLDANYVTQVADKLSSQSYTEQKFDKQVPGVLHSLTTLKDLDTSVRLSCCIIHLSPSVRCLWNLYHEISRLPNLLENCVDEFVSVYCKFILRRRAGKPDLLQPWFWSQVPNNLMERLASPFCKVLTEQISSETNWPEERLDGVTAIALDACLQSNDQFSDFVLAVMTHKSKEMVSIIPVLLESKAFSTYWDTRISKEDKQMVCFNWLKVNCFRVGKKKKEEILDVVDACESLCSTQALKMDKVLCQDMDKEVERLILKTKFESIMNAVKDSQNCTPAIQHRLRMLLRSAIKQQSGSGDHRSKYRKMVHLLGYDASKERKKELRKEKLDGAKEELILSILELIQMPPEGGKAYEEICKVISSHSEVWLPLLSALHAKSGLLEHPSVKTVLEALQSLIHPDQRQELHVDFYLNLKDDEVYLLATYCALVESEESRIDQVNVDEWMTQLSLARTSAHTFDEQFSKLEHTIRFLQEVSKGIAVISDADSLIREVNKRKREKKNTTLADVLAVDYWGTLGTLTDCEGTTTKLSECIIFRNVARVCLTNLFTSSETEVEELAGSVQDLPESKADEVLHLLESKVLQQFKEACIFLVDSSADPRTEEVDMLFFGITDEGGLLRELDVISSFCGRRVPKRKKEMLINYLHFPLVFAKVQQLMSIFSALGFKDADDSAVTKELQDIISSSLTGGLSIRSVSEIVESKSVAMIDSKLDDTLKTIMETLQGSSELISFMKETANEDIRILIDAVEEHSDQFVSEATVSDLIDVHGFLRNVLRETPKDPMVFLKSLKLYYSKLEKKPEMAAKIKQCSYNVHSLRGLYMNVANRGEMTKEIISNALQKGCYLIKTNSDGSCDVQLSYRRQGATKDTSYSMAELHDLRSRALLIVNTEKKQGKMKQLEEGEVADSSVNVTLSAFTKQVEMITDILSMVTLLRESGHPNFKKFWAKLSSSEEIESQAKSLDSTLKQWETLLSRLQQEHYFLNFFHPDQLWMIKKFFSRSFSHTKDQSLKTVVHNLLRFVDPRIQLKDLDSLHCQYKASKENLGIEGDFHAIGRFLDKIFAKHQQTTKWQNVPQQDLQRAVKPGELFVAVLEHDSKQTAHVVMSLFESTTGSYPQPSQVLFCHSETSWEEVERLLKRTFEAHRHATTVKLHCLANVENLSNDMQFQLVAAIRAYQESGKGPYLLSIVCCGGVHHHIVDQFSTAVHNVLGMTEVQLRSTFKKVFPEVFMVTSDLAGVGKTEAIYEHAASRKKKIVTIPISGPLSRKHLVKRLSGLTVGPHECIHFDVGEVDDPLVLDTLMFELVVVGMLSSGTELFHLPTKHVYIEIANTLRHWLQDSLPVTKCFSPVHIKLDGYEDLVVSQEPLSPIQVVCQYLHAYEAGLLESQHLNLGELKPLSPERCKVLLAKHFTLSGDLSYNIVESFIKVFADQLLQFSASPYFKPHNLKVVLGPSHDVRNCLFKALLEVSREFASRSVVTCKNVQSEAISREQATEVLKEIQLASKNAAGKMVERVEGMIQWADNNHLVIVFHSLEALTISALYRDLSLVPSNVQKLFKTQAMKGKGMEDFTKMNHKQLQERLDRIVRTTPRGSDGSLQALDYALTPDNILKMVLIIQRINAGIPVIVMGETGCGKTSLVRYLARTCDVPFHVFNFHAGITEDELVTFVSEREEEAKSGQDVWAFLDEINTCEYLGTVNEMICHRTIKGKPLPPNLVFIAACNPYRLRPSGNISTAGLSGKTITDEYSKLVYRVHPLPETMIDFVWDYGSLSKEDERAYISRMVEGITGNPNNLLVDLLCTSQEYVREVDKSPYCVSLRDAHRCIVLVKWFKETLKRRGDLPLSKLNDSRIYHKVARGFTLLMRSFVLALAHCYQSRLPAAEDRHGYRKRISMCFRKHNSHSFQESSFEAIVRADQEDYLERMELPEGTAKNAALRENVFVMLVCILNRIPVFVVGKPGCSKSLSMQIIRSNLRGKDAKDPFLKTLPQLYVVSHQGSESSTSDGILKVFNKARKYKEHNKSGDVLPVVLLDEIGLAEVSKYNPLKVLHSLLEPGDGAFPDVAVVGISNWALDAAKMNRAIHLSRPEPDVSDLFETGKSLREAGSYKAGLGISGTRSGPLCHQDVYPNDNQLHCLATAYQKYQEHQRYANFHGLRDYYSLIKCLSTDTNQNTSHNLFSEEKTKGIQRALQRNFGGVPDDVNNFQTLFQEGLHSLDLMEKTYRFPVTELICDNLQDKLARHLMIITNGDSAIGMLDQMLKRLDKEKITIFGSRFEEDLSEEYNYRMLSRIILCMERDCVLILRDLESIYGSLYDMLNQNYTVVGGKRNCRVALGAFSNPMCQVHDGFRCVVLIDQGRVDYTDPPFLNRFEKQLLRFSDVLNLKQRNIISSLNTWITGISTIPDFESHFHKEDMFVGFCDDTLPSVVLKNSQDAELTGDEILEQCKHDLMLTASPDGVVRSLQSSLAKTNFEEVQTLYNNYFQKPLHKGLKEYLKHSMENLQFQPERNEDATNGMRLLIMTHSNIHVNVLQCLEGLLQCQTEKLSAFKSEKHLTRQLERFWRSGDSLLVLQCKPELDATHMLLAKSIIEQQRQTYIKDAMEQNLKQMKHVCIVVHVQRESEVNEAQSQRWQFSFQSGWKQATIDVLENPLLPITDCLNVSITDLLETKALSFEDVASNQFLWCFTRIKYPAIHQPTVDAIVQLEQLLRSSSNSTILECFKEIVKRWLKKREHLVAHQPDARTWQFSVACDRQALISSSHLVGAIQHHVSHLIRQPLAKIVYFLENESAWPQFLFTQDPSDKEEMQVWSELILDQEIFIIDDIPEHQGAESYFVSERHLQLKFPCASVFYKKVEQVQPMFAEDQRQLLLNEANLDENEDLHDVAVEAQLYRFTSIVKEKIPQVLEMEYLQRNIGCYVDDLLDMKTAHFSDDFSRAERIDFMKSAMAHDIRFRIDGDPARLITCLHSLLWLNESSYMAALQVYQTCHKVQHVDFSVLSSACQPVFEKMLFQDKTPKETEDTQETEWRGICDKPEDAEVTSRGKNDCQEAYGNEVIEEDSVLLTNTVNDVQPRQCEQGRTMDKEDERKEVESKDDEATEEIVNDAKVVGEVKAVPSTNEQRELALAETARQLEQQEDETHTLETASSPIDDSLKEQRGGEINSHGNVNKEKIGGAVQSENEETAKDILRENECKDQNRVHGEGQFEKDRNVDKDHDQSEENSFKGQDGNKELENVPEKGMDLKEEDVEEADVEEEELTDEPCEDKPVSFDEVLVDTLCSALFPTKDVINGLSGPDAWQRTTSLFLSTVSRMGVQSPAFHFLRVCYDFVTLLVIPESLEQYSIYMLGELGKAGASAGYLDCQDVFNSITSVADELEKRGVQQNRLEDFLMLFYGRCIDANPDTPVLGSMLTRICCSGNQSLMRLAGPLVHRIFLDEEQLSSGVFEKLLQNLDTIQEHPGLQETSYALSSLADDVELDSPFAVVCCDLINEVAFLNIDLSTVSSSEDPNLVNFRRAFQTLTEPCEDVEHGQFHLLCAAAYLKSFLASFSTFILQRRQCLVEEGEFSMLFNEIDAAFSSSKIEPFQFRASGLQLYFLKELKKELSMYEVRDVCQRSCKLPSLKSIEWQDPDLVGKLSFDPFQSRTENSQAQAALATLLEKKDLKPLEDVIHSMATSLEQRIELAAVLTKSFYLVRSRRNLKDSEDKAIVAFTERLQNMETPYIELLLRITGRKDFKGSVLCVSPESLPADVHKATLILHLCILLSSSFKSTKKTTLALMSCFTNPLASTGSYVLASGEHPKQPCKQHNYASAERFGKTTSSSCSCGTFFVMVGDNTEAVCPSCRSECKAKETFPQLVKVGNTILPSKDYVSIPYSVDTSLHVRQLKPAEFRILHLFVHAALYGGFALELFDDKCLSQFMGLDLNKQSPSELCFQQIANDLTALCSLLDAKEEEIIRFLHCALEQSASILTSGDLCHTPDERLSWEKTFAAAVSPLIREFHPRRLLEHSKDFAGKSSLAIQRKIEETDSPQFSDANQRNKYITRLLRMTLPKTFNSLQAYYLAAGDKARENHPLLGLFLDFNDNLPLVSNLTHLVSWSRIVDSLLSRRLSRKDTSTKIGDVIRGKANSPEEKKRLTEAFENFTIAFANMHPVLKDRLQKEVPYLSESSPISLCLVEKQNQGVFLCAALDILQKIQNDFLRKVLSIAATGKCSALIFTERDQGKCAIPMVHLQEAREKEIIQYQWSDAILRHSQRNTEYGHGKEVFFDLDKIEKELSVRFLVGKAFLSTLDGLQEFIFSRDLFHSCRGILDELQELIPQQPLTHVFRSGLIRQSDHSLESVQDLLEHMEIVLCLIKRHQVGKPEEPLTDFTDKWLCGSRPFPKTSLPQPHSAIQLKHVVALYEFLEDMLAESAAKRVHDVYRGAVPKEIAEEMAKASIVSGKAESDRSSLNDITTALRRFIFRYLSSEEMRPEPGDSLVERMLEPSLWPIDMFKSSESSKVELSNLINAVFPENLTIAHTFQVLCFYQDRLKVMEEAKQVSRSPAPKGGRPNVSRARKGRARFGFS